VIFAGPVWRRGSRLRGVLVRHWCLSDGGGFLCRPLVWWFRRFHLSAVSRCFTVFSAPPSAWGRARAARQALSSLDLGCALWHLLLISLPEEVLAAWACLHHRWADLPALACRAGAIQNTAWDALPRAFVGLRPARWGRLDRAETVLQFVILEVSDLAGADSATQIRAIFVVFPAAWNSLFP